MKPSGLGWAGDIPADWDIAKICLVAKLESGHTPSRQHPEYWVPSECTIPWFSLADVWQLREGTQEYLGETSECISPMGIAHSAARLLPTGTVVLSRTASVGFAGIMPRPMATTQDFANWVPGERVVSEYLLYALRAMREEFSRVMTGSTHQTIYMPDIRRLAIPVPPRDEQQRIVAELRARLPRVDTLIAKQEQLLALLAEKRQGLITHAVTKGLDPNVPLKDSGVGWLGRIPSHWTVEPLGRSIRAICDGPFGSSMTSEHYADDGVRVIRLQNIGAARFNDGDKVYIAPEYFAQLTRHEVRPGDLLLAGLGDENHPVGRACVLPADIPVAMVKADCFRARLDQSRALHEYVAWYLASEVARHAVSREQRGSTRQRINLSGARRLLVVLPPLDEQERIVAHVRTELRRLDGLAQRAKAMVGSLREYRQALITAAVTGQLDAGSAATAAREASRHVEAEVA